MVRRFLFSIVAAFVPVLHIRACIAGMHVLAPGGLVTMAAVAAIGQTIGKTGWYEAGRGPSAGPGWRASSETEVCVRAEIVGSPPGSRCRHLVAVISVSLPPMAIMAVVAGTCASTGCCSSSYWSAFARFLATLGVLDVIVLGYGERSSSCSSRRRWPRPRSWRRDRPCRGRLGLIVNTSPACAMQYMTCRLSRQAHSQQAFLAADRAVGQQVLAPQILSTSISVLQTVARLPLRCGLSR